MFIFQANVGVLSVNQLPAPFDSPSNIEGPDQDVPHSIRALEGLFAPPNAPKQIERAPKRRKLDIMDTTAATQADFDETKSIVLAKVSLELHFPTSSLHGLHTESSHSGAHRTPIVVSFESFRNEVRSEHEHRIALWNTATATGADISASIPVDIHNIIRPHLQAAAMLATSSSGKILRKRAQVAFCHCQLTPHTSARGVYKLDVEIRWTLGISAVEHLSADVKHMKRDLKLLSNYSGASVGQTSEDWALSDFYDAVHVPPMDLEVSSRIEHGLTDTILYPFQRRTVDWLLKREGVAFSQSGTLESLNDVSLPALFGSTQDATGSICYINQLRGMIVTNPDYVRDNAIEGIRGGILAEEMGLGKTVELITLMSHHKRDVSAIDVYDLHTGTSVKPSGATLIITPPSILEQWISELHIHAPELRVLHYKGLPSPNAPEKEHARATVQNLMRHDVVVTTYNVLSKEIHHATPAPERSLRHIKRHERRDSPLMGISWWRVCLDEAQMVESGVSQAARVARMIPRCNAWAVSGTPLRKDVQDLRGLLTFLRCDSLTRKPVWDRLDKSSFRVIFENLALRHTKDQIRAELRLPPQKRVVITVPFTAIEDQHYAEMTRQMCDACWLTPAGLPLEEGRDVDSPETVERMREWLVRLRQTCLHANVGRKNRKALGSKSGALRTVHEVLEVMIEQAESSWKSEAREMIVAQIKLGHITAYAGNLDDRAQQALPYFEKALHTAEAYVAMCREDILLEKSRFSGKTSNQTEQSTEERVGLSDDGEEEKEEEFGRVMAIRKSLRSFLELQHACEFFIATTHHQIKENEQFTEPESEEFHRLDKLETEWYQKAKLVRRELLNDSKHRAQQQMTKVSSRNPFQVIPRIDDLPSLGGIEARKILDMMDNISDFLNAQAQQIKAWRLKIINILLMRLVDDDDDQETTGEEYDDSLSAQDELYVYIMALRTLIADRNAAVHGLQDTLVEHELKAAEKQATKKLDEDGGRGHAPELVIEVASTRRKLQANLEAGSLKGLVSGVRSLITGLQWRAENGDTRAYAELDVIQKHFAKIQTIAAQQAKALTELEREQEMFRAAMNQRLEYYRQFQHISDTVAKWKDELDKTLDNAEFMKYNLLLTKKTNLAASMKTKHTYLTHLRLENQTEGQAECIICQDSIEIGVLTACGHKYCKECLSQWWNLHRTCPLCKQKLRSSDFKDITFKPSEMKAREETQEPQSSTQTSTPGTSTTSIYSDISDSTLKEIKEIDLDGSYGTKVDMIARHLIWLRNNDPGAKSIIFSQFSDFLEVLREALKKWKIGVSSITDKDGIQQFKTDAGVEVFLLDAKSDSSGLNLVNATYVFLCEPLINPALELQAIARVHRIGQQRPTTVFMYLVSDTVEEAIYDISVSRRLEHIGTNTATSNTSALQETTLDAANSAELRTAPLQTLLRKKGNGEIVREDDLWRCLFGKPRVPEKPAAMEAMVEREVGRHLRNAAAVRRRVVPPGDGGEAEAEERLLPEGRRLITGRRGSMEFMVILERGERGPWEDGN